MGTSISVLVINVAHSEAWKIRVRERIFTVHTSKAALPNVEMQRSRCPLLLQTEFNLIVRVKQRRVHKTYHYLSLAALGVHDM